MTDTSRANHQAGSRKRKAIACTYCSEELRDAEERRHPARDEAGAIMCDECYDEHYREYCDRCQDKVLKTELRTNPGNLIAIWWPAPALASDDLSPGYYRVNRWPMFADGMIEGYFFPDALKREADLDDIGQRSATNACAAGGPLCEGCRDEIERRLEAEAA